MMWKEVHVEPVAVSTSDQLLNSPNKHLCISIFFLFVLQTEWDDLQQ